MSLFVHILTPQKCHDLHDDALMHARAEHMVEKPPIAAVEATAVEDIDVVIK